MGVANPCATVYSLPYVLQVSRDFPVRTGQRVHQLCMWKVNLVREGCSQKKRSTRVWISCTCVFTTSCGLWWPMSVSHKQWGPCHVGIAILTSLCVTPSMQREKLEASTVTEVGVRGSVVASYMQDLRHCEQKAQGDGARPLPRLNAS